MRKFTLTALLTLGLALGLAPGARGQNVIPRPATYAAGEGQFTFTAQTRVACEALPDSLKAEALRFVEALNAASGLGVTSTADATAEVVCLHVDDATLGAEGYQLNVAPEGVTLRAQTAAGFFYAFQTLKMLLPRNVMAERTDPTVTQYAAPACEVTDKPRFSYRGFMLDCARHFFEVDEIKRILDVMAYYKMNRFHWHLTDDQGWRFEMPKYPKLQTVAASRQGSWDVDPVHGRYFVADQYGPFYYTVAQMKEVVAYAAARHIDVIPEIEMPGHMCAAITAYPELSCDPYGTHRVWCEAGVSTDVLNVATPQAVQFCKDILDELTEIFPYEYIHIGGDECPSTAWEANADCQALMDSLGLDHVRELQSHFTHELAQYMAGKEDPAKRRRLIAWNESVTAQGSDTQLLRGDDLTIMCWVGAENASSVAQNLGMQTILTPQPAWYINRKQSPRPDEVHNAGSGTDATLEVVYNHRPTVRGKTLGVQGTFWCEHVSSDYLLEYQALPRLIAMAEVGWTQDNLRDFDDFLGRLRADTVLLNYGDYAWCDYLVRTDGDAAQVMPEAGKYYRLDSRASSPRAGRSVTLLSRDAPALAQYQGNGARVGLLWSDTAIDNETDTLRKYQSWQFVADPAGSGKYAMVCEAWPDGSVSPTASAASTDGTWSYDYTTRHYNFVLGEGSYYGEDGENHYYSIRSDQYTGQYMNMAAAGKQLRINVYGNPADGNGGLFTFVDLDPEPAPEPEPEPELAYDTLVSGKTYRIECIEAPAFDGLRLSDNGGTALGYAKGPWGADAWTVTASTMADGKQTLRLTNATTGRSVSSLTAPVRLGGNAVSLQAVNDPATHSFSLGTTAGALLIPVGEGYAVNPGTFTPTADALVPQGTQYRFVEVATITYTARDRDGRTLGSFTQSAELGKPYQPTPPEIAGHTCVTQNLTGTDSLTGNLTYELEYERTAFTARLRCLAPGGPLISEVTDTLTTEEAATTPFSWEAPELAFFTFDEASASPSFALTSDTVVDLTYQTEAISSFAERLEEVTEIEDGHYYLLYNNDNRNQSRNGFLYIHPETQQVLASYVVSGTPAHVWRAVKRGNGYQLEAFNGKFIPQLPSGSSVTASNDGDTFTFRYDGESWSIQGTNGRYFNGNSGGGFTGWSEATPYKVYTFRTEPYFTLTYICRNENGGSVGKGTYTYYVEAGAPYTLSAPADAPLTFPVVECSETKTSGTMTRNLTVTYTYKRRVPVGIDAVENTESEDRDTWYDLSGRPVRQPGKGVFIRNGEKRLVP